MELSKTRLLQYLSFAIILMTIADLWLASYLPIYSDEMGYRIIHGRYHTDGGVNTYLFPMCGSGYTLPTLWWMLPFRLLEEAFYNHQWTLTHLRLIGVLFHAISLGLTLKLMRLAFRNQMSSSILSLTILAFFGLGLMPFVVVFNRPDFWIRLTVMMWVLIPLIVSDTPSRLKQGLGLISFFIIPAAMICSMHLKSLLFLPLAIISLWYLISFFWFRLTGIATLFFIGMTTFIYWNARTACSTYSPDYFGQALSLHQLRQNPFHCLKLMLMNVFNLPQYWQNITFQTRHISDWLPGTPVALQNHFVNSLLSLTFSVMICIISVAVFLILKRRQITSITLIFVFLLLCTLLVAAVSVTKYFIETPLMLPLLGLTACLALQHFSYPMQLRLYSFLIPLIMVTWMCSQVLLFTSYYSHVQGAWAVRGYVPNQFISYNYHHYAETRKAIKAVAVKCDIDLHAKPKHLIIDDLTYLTVRDSYQPFNVLWTIMNRSMSFEEQMAYFKKVGSDGLITNCMYLPSRFLKLAYQEGSYCCLPAFNKLT